MEEVQGAIVRVNTQLVDREQLNSEQEQQIIEKNKEISVLRQEIDKIVSREKDASLNENEKSLKIQE